MANVSGQTEVADRAETPNAISRQALLIALLLALGTGAIYAPAARNGFVNFDDPDYVTQNSNVLQGITWHNIVWAFGTQNPAANWHPLTWISHMMDVQLYHLNPAGHHITNIVLHSLDVALLFLILQTLTGFLLRSAAVAALFALHPLNVEAVAWVAERKSVLCVFFFLLTIWAYAWYAKKPGWLRYGCALVLFACALMSKIMVITLPFGLLLLDYWPLRRFCATEADTQTFSRKTFPALVFEKVPFFMLAAVGGWITIQIHRKEGALSREMPFAWRLKNAIYSYAVYLAKTVWPARLAVFYPHPENTLSWSKTVLAGLLLVALSALVWLFRDKKYLTVGWLWFLGTMFPMIGIVQSGRQGMADRYAYIPLLGIFVAVVWALGEWATWRNVSGAVALGVFAAAVSPYIYATEKQISYWKNSYTLFSHAVEVTKNNGLAENNLGSALLARGESKLALPHLEDAVRWAPDLPTAHYNLGLALQLNGEPAEAAREYEQAIPLFTDPLEAEHAHHNLAVIYANSKEYEAATSELDKAIALNPNQENNYILRGRVELKMWNYEAAASDFYRAAQLAPAPETYYLMGQALEGKGNTAEAEAAYSSALRMAPEMTEARARLNALLGRTVKQ